MSDGNDPCRVCGANLWTHTHGQLQACGVITDPKGDEIARLTQEVAGLRLMLREVAATNSTGIDYALQCQRERDAARAALAAVEDGRCDDLPALMASLASARRWSRLWHAEARRLWREVQGLHGMIDDMRGLPREDD